MWHLRVVNVTCKGVNVILDIIFPCWTLSITFEYSVNFTLSRSITLLSPDTVDNCPRHRTSWAACEAVDPLKLLLQMEWVILLCSWSMSNGENNYLNTISDMMKESSSMSWNRQCPVPKTSKCIVWHSQSLFYVCVCVCVCEIDKRSVFILKRRVRFAWMTSLHSKSRECFSRTHSSWMPHHAYLHDWEHYWDL